MNENFCVFNSKWWGNLFDFYWGNTFGFMTFDVIFCRYHIQITTIMTNCDDKWKEDDSEIILTHLLEYSVLTKQYKRSWRSWHCRNISQYSINKPPFTNNISTQYAYILYRISMYNTMQLLPISHCRKVIN